MYVKYMYFLGNTENKLSLPINDHRQPAKLNLQKQQCIILSP